MVHPRTPQALGLVPAMMVTLLVTGSHSFCSQQQTFGEAQLTLPIDIEPMTLLTILKEYSTLRAPGNKIYRAYELTATHSQAIQACQQLGGRLALPTNEKEDLQIRRVIGIGFGSTQWPFPVYWISGSDELREGNFIDSVTGHPLNYTNYMPGQPDDAGGREDCLHKTTVLSGWNDLPCDFKGGYVCEFMDE